MTEGLHVVMDATENQLPGFDRMIPGGMEGFVSAVGGIPDGTVDGLAAVAVVITLPSGDTVMGQTTLALLNSATRALAARYPDSRP